MCRILRWVGYASTAIGAILIIMAIVGGLRFHHHYCNAHMQTCMNMEHPGGDKAVAKMDSASCKQHSMMGKQDSTKCCKKQAMCSMAAPMMCNSCQMHHARIGFHLGLAICFLLLAIALFMICNNCCCKKCCGDKECKCETKDEKKE
jgi:hypothetical protein